MERIFEAEMSDVGFKTVVALPAFGAVPGPVSMCMVDGVVRFSGTDFPPDFCAALTAGLLFTVVLGTLATAFAAVFSAFGTLFASADAAVFRGDLRPDVDALPDFVGAVLAAAPAAIFPVPFAPAPFAADLVTVAFMASSSQ